MGQSGASAYDCTPSISWVKDASQVMLVEGKWERTWSLRGVEAVIWDLLTLQYGFDQMVRFLAQLSEDTRENAAATLLATMQLWEEEGIVTANGREQDG